MVSTIRKSESASPSSLPKIWFNSSTNLFTPRHIFEGDCNCDCACSDPFDSTREKSQVLTLVDNVKDGKIRSISLNPATYFGRSGEYTYTLSAKGKGVIVWNAVIDHLFRVLDWDHTLDHLQGLITELTTDAYEHLVALLLARGVISSPQVNSINGENQAKVLVTWLHLINQCNLSCKYCYVPQNIKKMNIPTALRGVEAIFRSALTNGYPQVKLKYSGGEPTLNFGTLQAAQYRAEQLSAQTGIALETVILTNGIQLTDYQIDTLLTHNIRVMVSLDGIGRYQDEQRSMLDHHYSSFLRVSHTLERLLNRGISPHISITITEFNIEGLPDLVEYLIDKKLPFSFNFYRPPDQSSAHDPLAFSQAHLVDGLYRVYQIIERRLPEQCIFSGLSDRADLNVHHLRTCGVGQNYMVIDCDGNVAKCQMDMAHPIATIADDDPLALIRKDTGQVQNASVDQKECERCVWRYRCAGGCPRLTFQRTGRYDAKSPLCEVYRSILPEVMRLEALRLIKYEKPWDFSIQ